MIEVVFVRWTESLAWNVRRAVRSGLACKYVGYSQAGDMNTWDKVQGFKCGDFYPPQIAWV